MNNFEDKLNALIDKHNYKVSATLTESSNLKVDFADFEDVIYSWYLSEEDDMHTIEIFYGKQQNECIIVRSEFVRLFIFLDILRRCRRLNISPNVVRFYNEEGKPAKFTDLIRVDLTPEGQKLEATLDGYADQILNGKPVNQFYEKLEKAGLLYNFSLLIGMMV